MSAWAPLGLLECPEQGCNWHIDQGCATPGEHQRFLDELTGHRQRVHSEEAQRNGAKLDDVMSIECPFKEESMRAAFYVGWLAARR